MALRAMPVSTMVITSVRPSALDAAYTTKTVTTPPTKAATVMLHVPKGARPDTMMITAPSAAPDDTPTMPGSASGLLNVPCMRAPAQPSDPPTSDGEGDAWEPDLPEDVVGQGVRRGADVESDAVEDGADDLAEADGERTDRARQHHQGDEGEAQTDDQGHAGPRPVRPGPRGRGGLPGRGRGPVAGR